MPPLSAADAQPDAKWSRLVKQVRRVLTDDFDAVAYPSARDSLYQLFQSCCGESPDPNGWYAYLHDWTGYEHYTTFRRLARSRDYLSSQIPQWDRTGFEELVEQPFTEEEYEECRREAQIAISKLYDFHQKFGKLTNAGTNSEYVRGRGKAQFQNFRGNFARFTQKVRELSKELRDETGKGFELPDPYYGWTGGPP